MSTIIIINDAYRMTTKSWSLDPITKLWKTVNYWIIDISTRQWQTKCTKMINILRRKRYAQRATHCQRRSDIDGYSNRPSSFDYSESSFVNEFQILQSISRQSGFEKVRKQNSYLLLDSVTRPNSFKYRIAWKPAHYYRLKKYNCQIKLTNSQPKRSK
jgi:hypothetical protein